MSAMIAMPKRQVLFVASLVGLLGCQSAPPMTLDADLAERVAELSGQACARATAGVLAAEGHAASDLVSVGFTRMSNPLHSGTNLWGYLASIRLTGERAARVYLSPDCRPTAYATS